MDTLNSYFLCNHKKTKCITFSSAIISQKLGLPRIISELFFNKTPTCGRNALQQRLVTGTYSLLVKACASAVLETWSQAQHGGLYLE